LTSDFSHATLALRIVTALGGLYLFFCVKKSKEE